MEAEFSKARGKILQYYSDGSLCMFDSAIEAVKLAIELQKQNPGSIAVLPFINMSADPDNEYFSDGITDELINALTKVDGLSVISRTSSFTFKGTNDDIQSIGSRLRVNKIIEGSNVKLFRQSY